MYTILPAIHEYIITLLLSNVSGHSIHQTTDAHIGTISKICSKYCPEAPKSSGGHPNKFKCADISYAKHLTCRQKADNAMQVTKSPQDVKINFSPLKLFAMPYTRLA